MKTDFALAVDIGGTKLRSALVGVDGTVHHRNIQATPANDGAHAVLDAITNGCQRVTQDAGGIGNLSLGLCAPGPIDSRSGIALGTPTIRGFENFPLREAVSNRLGIRVVIENDGPTAALGEWCFGAAHGMKNVAYVTISTGIGGGFIVDGKLIRGHRGLAAHVGHIPTQPDGEICFCGMRGHWEAQASGSALNRKAQKFGYEGLLDVLSAFNSEDEIALKFMEEAADEIAYGLVTITHLLDPEAIVIGGGVSNAFVHLEPLLRARLDQLLLPPFREVKLIKSALGDDSGLIGASQLIFDNKNVGEHNI